ncbi:MAG: ribbon-helix-helix protein, CopG family [Acidobacteria bacterium]|nr:MAG: ribbon-helix-helix protein, CopG family [Acidobacteriota bacterium]RPJ63307.1 MAG: ribbon-helix-helix protein, CopG family [Acidobacteriota bacterium]
MTEDKKKTKEAVYEFINSAKQMATEVSSEIAQTAERLFEEAKSAKRQIVVSVRLDDESARRVDQLVEAGICSSRSEAVAMLTKSGIQSRSALFDRIEAKIREIQRIKDEIRQTASEVGSAGGPPPA